MFTIIAMTSADPRFAGTVGPYVGSAVLAAELDAEVADRPGKTWWVAAAAGVTVGFCGALDTGHTVEIETLWVDLDHRGHGIGGQLLREVVDAYAGRRLHAWCSTASRGLFLQAGFRIVQTGFTNGVWWYEVERDASAVSGTQCASPS